MNGGGIPLSYLENTLQIKFKKLSSNAVTPTYAKFGDAGLDMTATSIKITDDYIQYGTDIAVEIPYGYVGLIFPRSSVSKQDLVLANSVGVIDSGYRGEVCFRFKPMKISLSKIYEIGEKIGQLVVLPVPEVDLVEVKELSDSERGEGGFGSTTVKGVAN